MGAAAPVTSGSAGAGGSGAYVDPRVLRTRRALTNALAELIEETPQDQTISMSAVAARAGLSRQVLHSHFRSIGELAVVTIVSRVVGADALRAQGIDDFPRVLMRPMIDLGLDALLERLQADRDFIRRARSRQETSRVYDAFTPMFIAWVRGTTADVADGGTEPDAGSRPDAAGSWTSDASQFAVGGTVRLVDSWLDDEEPPAVQEQERRLRAFLSAVAGISTDPR